MNISNNVFVETKDFIIQECTYKKPMPEMHFHNSFEVYYLIEGERDYFIGDRFFKAHKGDFVIVPQHELHRTAGMGANRMLLFFTDNYLRKYFSESIVKLLIGNIHPSVLHPKENNESFFLQCMRTMLKSYNAGENTDSLIPYQLSRLLFNLTVEENAVVPFDNTVESKLETIIHYINENCERLNTLDDILEDFFISKYYFCRLFKENLGVTPMAYLRKIKIKRSCALLSEGDMPEPDIAMSCGFCSTSYFAKVFREEMGLLPSKYRKQNKNDS